MSTLWLIARTDGREPCVAVRFTVRGGDTPPGGAPPDTFANGGIDCAVGGASQPPGQIQVFLSWYPAHGSPWRASPVPQTVLVYGHVPDNMGIVQALLASRTGTRKLELRDGFFFVWLPGDTKAGMLPGTTESNTVVAVDSKGQTVATANLGRVNQLSQPPSG